MGLLDCGQDVEERALDTAHAHGKREELGANGMGLSSCTPKHVSDSGGCSASVLVKLCLQSFTTGINSTCQKTGAMLHCVYI